MFHGRCAFWKSFDFQLINIIRLLLAEGKIIENIGWQIDENIAISPHEFFDCS